jgi:hypothetical protein
MDFAKHILLRGAIYLLRAIAPVSCIVTSYYVLTGRPTSLWSTILFWYCAIETGLLILVCLPLKYYLQRPATHPTPLPKEEHDILISRCSQSIDAPDYYLKRWFADSPIDEIKLENVKEFLRWAFWGTDDPDAVPEADLNYCVSLIQERIGTKLEPGTGNSRSLRVTIDHVDIVHRPFIWYTVRISKSCRQKIS